MSFPISSSSSNLETLLENLLKLNFKNSELDAERKKAKLSVPRMENKHSTLAADYQIYRLIYRFSQYEDKGFNLHWQVGQERQVANGSALFPSQNPISIIGFLKTLKIAREKIERRYVGTILLRKKNSHKYA